MTAILLEQALYSNAATGGYRFLARSAGFRDNWLPEAERLCVSFGERPAGVACPQAVFAQPFGAHHVAVVQVADLGSDDTQRPGALGFRLLVLPRSDYTAYLGDPFVIAERFPPCWSERGTLPTLTWPAQPLPPRTVEQVQHVLQNGDSPTLLGSVQALLDAGKVVYEKPAPDPDLLRALWLLLPYSTRAHLWPASFAFSNALGFDVLVMPRIPAAQCVGYLTGDQAGDYPEGRYELSLQQAAEAGDQQELDALFYRRSSDQTLRLGLFLVVGMVVLAVAMNLLNHGLASRAPSAGSPPQPNSALEAVPQWAEAYPPLSEEMRQTLVQALRGLAEQVHLRPVPEAASVEQLLHLLQPRLIPAANDSDPHRAQVYRRWQQVGPADHPEHIVRGWLWAYGLSAYNDPRLNIVELVELLQQKLAAQSRGAAHGR